MKKLLEFFPFLLLPIAYDMVIYSGFHSEGLLTEIAVALNWLPIAVCLLYFLAQRLGKTVLAESGLILHTILSIFVLITYHYSLGKFYHRWGFVNRGIFYRIFSVVLVLSIIYAFVRYIRCIRSLRKSAQQ